jgi:hypothetical protein
VTRPLGPSVVDDSVDERVNDCTVLATVTSVSSECGGSGIGDEGSGNNARLSASQAREHLEDGLELGVIEGIWRTVGVDTKCVDLHSVNIRQVSTKAYGRLTVDLWPE